MSKKKRAPKPTKEATEEESVYKEPLPTPQPIPRVEAQHFNPCSPPWPCEGYGEWCDCECLCCPPCPCYTGDFTGCFQVGSPAREGHEKGCKCQGCGRGMMALDINRPTPTPTPLIRYEVKHIRRTINKKKLAKEEFTFEPEVEEEMSPMPEFDYDPAEDFKFNPEIEEYVDEEGNIVRVLSGPCSIPCTEGSISVSFSGGCCFLDPFQSSGTDTLQFKFKPAKDGTVFVNSPDQIGCATIKTFINGEETKEKQVNNCEIVLVEIVASGGGDECCQICSFAGALPSSVIPQCEGQGFMMQKVNVKTGEKKLLINKKNLLKPRNRKKKKRS